MTSTFLNWHVFRSYPDNLVFSMRLYRSLLGFMDRLGIARRACLIVYCGFLDPRGGGKKNKKQVEQPAGKNNTNGSCRFGLVSGFLLDMRQVLELTLTINCNTPSTNIVNVVSPTINRSDQDGLGSIMKDASSSYANKLSPMWLNKANIRKLDANVPKHVDFDIWLPLALVNEVNDRMKDSLYRDGPWMIRGVPIFLNKWSPSVSLLKEEFSRVLVWVKFHDVLLVAYTSDGLSLIATKIGTLIMLDSEVMAVHNLEGLGYLKEIICVEYEWEPPYCSTCLIFGHSVFNCPKSLKRVVNKVDKGNGGSSKADDECFVLVKQKTHYRPKVNQSTEGTNGKKNVSTSGNSLKRASMPNVLTSGNGTFSLSNSFKVLNVNDLANVEVELGNKASTSSVKGEGQSATPLVEKINMLEKHIMEGTCVLVDDDGKPIKKVDYIDDHDSEDEVAPVDNEMANFLASKMSGVRYGTKSLLEQYRETYENVEYDYDPYDDELYPYSI
ncbi:zinc knuckle CX2CX4HX4C containing protein [Tanacetum coccineum]